MVEKNAKASTRKAKPPRSAAEAKAGSGGPQLHDLLTEQLITVREGEARSRRSLPEVLALLGAKRVDAFPALQAFQQHAWHAFLVQLASMALHRAGETSPRQSSARWAELLLDLTQGEHEPWCLVVPNLAKPAFMQPPVPERSLDGFKEEVGRPDLIDVLILARNHDVKMGRMDRAVPEHWVFALVSLQTMQGVSGKWNYGIARMNKGYGSRPGIGLAQRLEPGWRFARDVKRLLSGRAEVLEAHEQQYEENAGRALLWVETWDGSASGPFQKLDPYFIEVCRRVRLEQAKESGRLVARLKPTKAPRLAAKELHGVTGDPWTPVNPAKSTAFTASATGFSYRDVQRLLSDEFTAGVALSPSKDDGDSLFVGEVVTRGEGETNGYHHRAIPVPAKVVHRLGDDAERKALGDLAMERVETVGTVARSVLLPALLTLVQGDPKKPRKLDYKDERPRRWLDAFENVVDAEFFEQLWADLDRPPAEARREWETYLLALARVQLDLALESAPTPSAQRYRAIAGADRMFEARKRKNFKHLFDQPGEAA